MNGHDNGQKKVSRRGFLKAAAAAGAATAAAGCGGNGEIDFAEFFQSHFKEMSKDEVRSVIKRLEDKYSSKYGKQFTVKATEPMENVLFGYALDLSRCIGCRRCVYACVRENNQSRDPQIHWITVLRFKKGEKWMDLEESEKYYSPDKVPEEGYFYMPVQCQQCKNPPCTKVCPVQATWTEPDGMIVVDYNWCIGCRYCMAACPYGARRFNLAEPGLPKDEANPNTHYLGNRPRYRGVVEKCTFCVQRTREGKYPACVEICPVGARKFGNLLDKDSEVRYIIEHERVFRLKEDMNTQPKFFYFFSI
ncbi:MAG: 4Fe-4S dicluster domain-containing protein [Nitrospinae bacterium]|nr:4Fe-4S dicluster domain-containing protein [Nitrospinota bacterium]